MHRQEIVSSLILAPTFSRDSEVNPVPKKPGTEFKAAQMLYPACLFLNERKAHNEGNS